MADFDPSDRTQPLQAPASRLASRDELCGPRRPSAPLSDDQAALVMVLLTAKETSHG